MHDFHERPLVPPVAPSFAEVLRFALPMALGLLVQSINSLVDILFISQLGTMELAAVPFASYLYMTYWIFIVGIMRSSIVFIGNAYGAGRYALIGKLVGHYHLLALAGVPWIFSVLFFWDFWVGVAQIEADVAACAFSYIEIRVWDVLFSWLALLYANIYQAQGKSFIPMMVAIFGILVNILLNYLLIFGNFGFPELGVVGSAIATLIANMLIFMVFMVLIYRNPLSKLFQLHFFVPLDFRLLKNILRVAIPQGGLELVEIIIWLSVLLLIGGMGKSALAASNICIQIVELLVLPALALGMAGASYTARFLGAGYPEIADQVIWRILRIGLGYTLCLSVPIYFFAIDIAKLFTQDEAVIAYAATIFKLIAVFYLFDTFGLTLRIMLGSAGDTFVPMLLLLGCGVGVMLPFSYLFANWIDPPVIGIWLAIGVYTVALAGAMFFRYRSKHWMNFKLHR